MTRRGMVLFLTLSVIWGLPYLMIRIAVQHGVDPGTLVFLRTAPAALILLPLAWRAGALRPVLARWRWLVVYAFVHFGVPWLLMSNAEQHLSSSVTGMLVATVPLVAAVVALRTHPEERFGPARVAGLALGLARRGPPRRLRRRRLELGVDRGDGRRRPRLRDRPRHHLAAPRRPPGRRRRRLRGDGRRARLHPLRRDPPAVARHLGGVRRDRGPRSRLHGRGVPRHVRAHRRGRALADGGRHLPQHRRRGRARRRGPRRVAHRRDPPRLPAHHRRLRARHAAVGAGHRRAGHPPAGHRRAGHIEEPVSEASLEAAPPPRRSWRRASRSALPR